MPHTQRSVWPGLALAAVGAIAFSGKAIIVKLSYRYGVDAVTVIMLRMLFALPFFVLLGWWAGRRPHAKANPLTRRDALHIVGLGLVGYYLASYLDFLGLQYISASLERLILYLNPTLVLILSWLLYQKPVQPIRLLAMAISYSGVLLVFAHELTFVGTDVALGSGLVFASAVAYALYLIYSGQLVQHVGAMRLVGWATSVACVCCLVQFAVLRPLSVALVPVEVMWLAVVNALACTVAPVLMVMMAVERLGAGTAAQVGMIGPMANLAMGVWWLNEPLNAWIGLGTLLVLSGVFLVSKFGAK
jgi:drug/metabolite transporter (DMT)-like permease